MSKIKAFKVQCSTLMIAVLAVALIVFSSPAFAFDPDTAVGDQMFALGQYEQAAKWYAGFVTTHAVDSDDIPHALINLGNSLDKMTDKINALAEDACFRHPKGSRGTPCMKAYAEKLNEQYGAGSFEFSESLILIVYTGAQYKKVMNEFPKSPFMAEAAYMYLTKNLIGHPDDVLPRVKEYMSKYKSGEWGRKGKLLWARINEDIWWVHRKWSWVLYNWTISPEELIIKAEPYRQEALRTFKDMMNDSSEEGKAAKKEYEQLIKYQDDGKLYGIVNESSVK